MDANKEEADACIEKAINYLRTGDREKAEKFLIKANNMYPSSKAEGKSRDHRIQSINANYYVLIAFSFTGQVKSFIRRHHRLIGQAKSLSSPTITAGIA